MNEKTLSEFLDDLEEALRDITYDADLARKRAELLEERLEDRTCHAVEIGNDQHCCSICGFDGWIDKDAITNYCSDCGAKVVQR